jgi:hypothetical protein
VRFLSTEEGGRTSVLKPRLWGGYGFRFPTLDNDEILGEQAPENLQWGSFLLVEGDADVAPGDDAVISILSLQFELLRPHLRVGLPIHLLEGNRLTGVGELIEVRD